MKGHAVRGEEGRGPANRRRSFDSYVNCLLKNSIVILILNRYSSPNTYVISGGRGYQNTQSSTLVMLLFVLHTIANGVSASPGGGIAAVDAPADQQVVPFAQHDLS